MSMNFHYLNQRGKNDFIRKNVGIVQPFLNVFVESGQFYEFLPNEQHIKLTLLNANNDNAEKYAEWLSELTAVKNLRIEDTNSHLLVRAFDKLWKNRKTPDMESMAWGQLETIQANFKASDLNSIQLLTYLKRLEKITLVLSNADDAKIVQKGGFQNLSWNGGFINSDKPNIVEFTKIHQMFISNLS